MNIVIQESAARKVLELLEMEEEGMMLRAFVKGGGCSGFQYGFTFDKEKTEDDFEIVSNEVHLLVDSISAQYLEGASIDYKESLFESQFVITNPNATTTCGCGASFAI